MKLIVASRIAANTALARFAPDHGKQGFRVEPNGDVTIMVIDNCDHCGCECEGANSITFHKPRAFVMDAIAMRRIVKTEVTGEIGCTEDGDAVCPECYAKQAKLEAAG